MNGEKDQVNKLDQAQKQKVDLPVKRNIPVKVIDKKEQTSLTLRKSKKKKLKELADSVNMSMSELVEYWIDQN